MKIFVVRHGKTKLNGTGVFNGSVDEDISEVGIEQAKVARENLINKLNGENLNIDVIYCSTMLRARHTCQIINYQNLPVKYDSRIVERTFGEIDGKALSNFGKEMKDFMQFDYIPEGIKNFESNEHLFKRVHEFLDEIIKENKEKNILIVTHGLVLQAINFYFNEIPENGDLSIFRPSNAEIYEYEVKDMEEK